MKKFLMQLARSILQNVLQTLSQLENAIQEQALNVVKQLVAQVIGGEWTGLGADKFMEEINSIATPKMTTMMSVLNTHASNLNKAREIMDRAESEAKNKMGALADVFKFF